MSEVKILMVTFLAALASVAHGTDYVWNGGTSGEWTTGSNWTPSTGYPNGAGDTASFSPSAATAVTVGSTVEVSGITVGGTGALTITGSAITLGAGGITSTSTAAVGISNDLAIATAATPLAVNGPTALSTSTPAGPLHLGGVVSGSGGLYKTGSGEVHIYGANTFTGTYEALGNRKTKTGTTITATSNGSGETFIYNGSALGVTHAYFDKGLDMNNSHGARLTVAAPMTIGIPIQLTGDYANNHSLHVNSDCDVTFNGDVDSRGRARIYVYTNGKARFKGKLTHANYLDMHVASVGAEVFLHKPISGSNWVGDSGKGGKVHLFGTGGTAVNWFQNDGIIICEDENVIPPSLDYFQIYTANCYIELNGYDQKITKVNLAKLVFNSGAIEKISSPAGHPAKMRFVGANVPSLGMILQFDGTAGMEWDPQSASKVYVQSNTVSGTTGELDVKSGVYRLANGATFTQLSSFKLAAGARFEVESGSGGQFFAMNAAVSNNATFLLGDNVSLSVGNLILGGNPVAEGTELTAASHPELISGNGSIIVSGAHMTAYWTGAAGGRWGDAANWSIGAVPDENYDVMLTNASVVVDEAITPVHALTVGNGSEAATITVSNANSTITAHYITIANKGVITCAGPFTNETQMSRVHLVCTNLAIVAGGKIDVTQKGWSGGLWMFVGDKNTAVSYFGFGPGAGGYAGISGGYPGYSGAWHGGRGSSYWLLSNTQKVIYGDAVHPETAGSGGDMPIGWGGEIARSRGWSGGGVVRIEASGSVTVNGSVLADGGGSNNNGGSRETYGSGGSIWITCKAISGSGTVRAAGGSGGDPRYPVGYWRQLTQNFTDLKNGFPGGGGRVAIDYDPGAQAAATVDGLLISAAAGEHYSGYSSLATRDVWEDAAESGTLHFSDTAFVKRLFGKGLSGRVVGLTSLAFDGDLEFKRGFFQPMEEGFTLTVAGNLVVTGAAARLEVGGVCMTNLSSRPTIWGGTQLNSLVVGGDFTVVGGGSFAIRAAETNALMDWGAEVRVSGAMTVGTNGHVYASSDGKNLGSPRFLVGSLTVAKGGVLSASHRGGLGTHSDTTRRNLGLPTPDYGYGPGGGYLSGAAGHGGRGGWSGTVGGQLYDKSGAVYDDEWFPVFPGSGGGTDIGKASAYGAGGTGGGIVHVTASGPIIVDGEVSSDGGMDAYYSSGNMYRFGAGSGGTVFLLGESFAGGAQAKITAKGGDGYQDATGAQLQGTGGGGCVAIWTGYGVYASGSYFAHKFRECPFEYAGSFDVAPGGRLLPPDGSQPNSAGQIAFSIGEAGTVRFGVYELPIGLRVIIR